MEKRLHLIINQTKQMEKYIVSDRKVDITDGKEIASDLNPDITDGKQTKNDLTQDLT